MTQEEKLLLQAVQKTLWGAEITFPEDTDWGAVLKEAEAQAILGLVVGVAPERVQREWQSKANTVTARFVRILHYQQQLYSLLRENDIPMAILKGTAAAIYYPNPSQRSMGDIDYLVPLEAFDRAKALLVENGYKVEDDPKYPRHAHVSKDGIPFEQHRFFSSEGVQVEPYVLDGMSHIEVNDIYGSRFPMLPKLANGLVLLGHLVQHLRSGLGLRQAIDWMLYVDRVLDDAFWEQTFQKAAQDTGLAQVAVAMTRMCQMYLGLSEEIHWCKGADPTLCTELIDSLLSSGNFARKRGRGAAVEGVVSSISRKGLFRQLQTAGEKNWRACQKHRWLRPFAWAYQIVRYAKKGFQAKRSGAQLREDIERGKHRIELYRKLGIQEERS